MFLKLSDFAICKNLNFKNLGNSFPCKKNQTNLVVHPLRRVDLKQPLVYCIEIRPIVPKIMIIQKVRESLTILLNIEVSDSAMSLILFFFNSWKLLCLLPILSKI